MDAAAPADVELVELNEVSGLMEVRLAPEFAKADCEPSRFQPLRVVSAVKGDRAWAWALETGADA